MNMACAGSMSRRFPNGSTGWSTWMSRPTSPPPDGGLGRNRRGHGRRAAVARAGGQARVPAAPWHRLAAGTGSSLVVRAGYGIYRNTNIYQSIANQLAQQPPLSTTFEIQNSLRLH